MLWNCECLQIRLARACGLKSGIIFYILLMRSDQARESLRIEMFNKYRHTSLSEIRLARACGLKYRRDFGKPGSNRSGSREPAD